MVGLQEFSFEDHLPLGLPGRAYKSRAPCSRMYVQFGEPSNRGVESPMKSHVAFMHYHLTVRLLCFGVWPPRVSGSSRTSLHDTCCSLYLVYTALRLTIVFSCACMSNCIVHFCAPACQIAFSCAYMSSFYSAIRRTLSARK